MDLEKELKEYRYEKQGKILRELDFTQGLKVSIYQRAVQQKKGRRQMAMIAKTVSGIAVAVALTTGVTYNSDSTGGLNGSSVESVFAFELYDDDKIDKYVEQGMTVPYAESRTDQGVTVTVTDIYYDGEEMFIGYVIRLPENWKGSEIVSKKWNPNTNITINDDTSVFRSVRVDMKKVNDNLYAAVEKHRREGPLVKEPLPDSFKIKLEATEIGNIKGTGKWKWELPFTMPKEAQEYLQTFEPNVKAAWNDLSIQVDKVLKNASTTSVFLTVEGPKEKRELLQFNASSENSTEAFQVKTERRHDETSSKIEVWWDTRHKEERALLLKPYFFDFARDSVDLELENKYPIEKPLADGSAVINKVEYLAEKTLVHYELKQITNYLDHNIYSNELRHEEGSQLKGKIVPSNKNSMQFTAEFPAIDPKQKSSFDLSVNTKVDLSKIEKKEDKNKTISIPLHP
ncbi:DUF4179 domain-containing protein [Brevibacillus daliensis]|uniref:DUF4179 domain-containing protein n=1 Tax=Brevibacillus daliensis TaxID=2892995 RepID=UPI001E5329A8|nr:DUF4179 domain-containing protein [Brevibacillus daliensis]